MLARLGHVIYWTGCLFAALSLTVGWIGTHFFFSLRWYRRAALRVALYVPCGVSDVVLHALCVVPDAVLRGPRVVPDAVPYQTSASQWKAWRGAASGRQHLTPSELQARLQVQTQLRIQKSKSASTTDQLRIPNVHPYQAPFAALLHVAQIARVAIDLNQAGRRQQIHHARLSRR